MGIELGNKILSMREAMHLTQTELGKLCGTSRNAVSDWERGVSVPRSKMLAKIAAALETTVDELTALPEQDIPVSPALSDIEKKFGSEALQELNELYTRTAGLFAGGTLSQKAKDAYFAAITQAYLDCRAAAESAKDSTDSE